MKKLLLSITLMILSTFGTKAQDKIKYQGASFPLSIYWEVVQNNESYFKSKMKGENVFWYVQYLGENLSNEDASKGSVRFLKALKLDLENFDTSNPKKMKIGKKGVAARLQWKGLNKNNKESEFFAYLYRSSERKGKTKFFIMVYEAECEYEGYCSRYWLHRESYEKEFRVK